MGLFEFSEGEEEIPADLIEKENGRKAKKEAKREARRRQREVSGKMNSVQNGLSGNPRLSGELSTFLVCNVCSSKYEDWEVSFDE